MKKKCFLIVLSLLSSSCAILHHVQIGDIDNRKEYQLKPIEMKTSEMGVDLNDVKLISKNVLAKDQNQQLRDIMNIIELFQMGPRTGAPVYTLAYLKDIDKNLRSECPNGFLTGIESIRETRKYPVISGEIIKIKAYCATRK